MIDDKTTAGLELTQDGQGVMQWVPMSPQKGDAKARAFLVSTMENKNVPMAERLHAASLLLRGGR